MSKSTLTTADDGAELVSVSVDALAPQVAALRRIKSRQAKLARERKGHEAAVRALLAAAGASVGTVGGVPAVSVTTSLRIALDQSVLKARYPEIARECADISEVVTFRLIA